MHDHPELSDLVDRLEAEPLPALIAPVRVAALLDMDKRRVYDLVAMGEFAGVRVGKRGLRIFRDSLFEWLRRGGSA